MIEVKKIQKENKLLIWLVGAIDDSVNFDTQIGSIPPGVNEVHVDCGGINRVNSVGVKSWIQYFQKTGAAGGTRLSFWNCSPSIVYQVNIVANFLGSGTIESMQLLFSCDDCGHEFVKVFEPKIIKKLNFEIPPEKCGKCQAQASFDDLPKVYFRSLMMAK